MSTPTNSFLSGDFLWYLGKFMALSLVYETEFKIAGFLPRFSITVFAKSFVPTFNLLVPSL
jgi:hypothetical protein